MCQYRLVLQHGLHLTHSRAGKILPSATQEAFGMGRIKAPEEVKGLRCDDRSYPFPTGPVLRCTLPPSRVDGQTDNPDGERHYWTREVSPDRKQMTISEYKDRRRVKVRSVMLLDASSEAAASRVTPQWIGDRIASDCGGSTAPPEIESEPAREVGDAAPFYSMSSNRTGRKA